MDTQQPARASETALDEAPEYSYLLREVRELYRTSGAGGSGKIRTHQHTVRSALSKVMEANPPIVLPQPVDKPAKRHLRRALDRGLLGQMAPLVRTLDHVADDLAWLYGYDRVPKGLAERYAFAELAGPRGPVKTRALILGLVLFAPRCTYPAHAHDEITESYYVLSGTVSENDDGVWAPGSLIFNPPGRLHRITVSDREPALLLYAWTGDPDALGELNMTFSRPKPSE